MGTRAAVGFIICFLCLFTGFGIRYGYGVLLPSMLPSLSLSKTDAGIIYTCFFISYTAISPVVGYLADRVSIRTLLTVSCAVLGIGAFLMSFQASRVGASICFGIAGAGAAGLYAPVIALSQRFTSKKRRGLTLSIITAGGASGTFVISLLMPIVISWSSWRVGWKLLGILSLVVGLISLISIREPLRDTGSEEKLSPRLVQNTTLSGGVESLIGNRIFWYIGLSYMLIGFSVLVPFTFLSTYAVEELKFSYESAGHLIAVIALSSGVGRFFLGALSDTFGRIRLIMIAAALVAIGVFGMAFYGKRLWLLCILLGFGHGSVWPLYAACASDFFSKGVVGTIIGMWTLFFGLGSILCPAISGIIADATGSFTWSFGMAGFAAVLSGVLLYGVGEKPALVTSR